ncbi:MAG: hypothetical protein JW841_08510 [Deltaproteobacteria bacterium]|nr:hypothetical protein [Deltaproteobacteria bacterium]
MYITRKIHRTFTTTDLNIICMATFIVLVFLFNFNACFANANEIKLPKSIIETIYQGRNLEPLTLLSSQSQKKGETVSIYQLPLPESKDNMCKPFEYWLVISKAINEFQTQLLFVVCNDGYGAANLGEDSIKVNDGTITYSKSGGSAWRWDNEVTFNISSLEITHEVSSSFHTLSPNSSKTISDWNNFIFSEQRQTPLCESLDEKQDTYTKLYDTEALLIPIFQPSITWDMQTTSLGSCGVYIDSTGNNGFIIHGQPGETSDAYFFAMLTQKKELWLEVVDDHFINNASSWLYDDHFEIWLANKQDDLFCVNSKESPDQWGIRAKDGKVFPGYGSPSPLVVKEIYSTNDSVRMRIALPNSFDLITVVYSDSDDGKKQKRLIATSKLSFAKLATLGAYKNIPETFGKCEVYKGQFMLNLEHKYKIDFPKTLEH